MARKRNRSRTSKALVKYQAPAAVGNAAIGKTKGNGSDIARERKRGLGQKPKKQVRMPAFAAIQCDPFHPDLVGTKVPDVNSMPSLTNVDREEVPITIQSSSINVFAIRPQESAYLVPYGTLTSNTQWTWPASFGGAIAASQATAMQTNYELCRPVSFGVRISTRLSALNASGSVHIALVAEQFVGSTWDYPTTMAQLLKAPYYRSIPVADLINNSIVVPGRFMDESAFTYRLPNVGPGSVPAGTLAQTRGWGAIVVLIEGAPGLSGEIVRVEYICHYEGILSNGPSAGGTSTSMLTESPAALYSPAAIAATKNMSESLDPIRLVDDNNQNSPTFWDDCSTLFESGLKVANGVINAVSSVSGALGLLFL